MTNKEKEEVVKAFNTLAMAAANSAGTRDYHAEIQRCHDVLMGALKGLTETNVVPMDKTEKVKK